MLTCENYQDLISALLDEEITEDLRERLMAHLAECDACRAALADQMAMREAMHSLSAAAPEGFADGVMARVRETAQERGNAPARKVIPFPGLRRWAGLAACCAVVLLGIFALGDGAITMNQAATDAAAPETCLEAPKAAANTTNGAAAPPAEHSMADAARADMGAADYGYADDALEYDAESYTTLLICGSDTAKEWVRENLSEDWIPGTYYELSETQYDELKTLLTERGEPFTEQTGTDRSNIRLLLAE